MTALSFLADAPATQSTYVPFWTPLPTWDYWYLLLIPLCLGVSIIYKAIKCHEVKQEPKEAMLIFQFIILGMVAAAAILMGFMRWMER